MPQIFMNLSPDTKNKKLFFLDLVEASKEFVPKGKGKAHVFVLMLLTATMVDLVLGRAHKNMVQRSKGKPYMGVSKIASKKVKGKIKGIDS